MKKFVVRSDMEGLFGVVNWEEVIPGTATYEKARSWLHWEVGALAEGLLMGGGDQVEIYDEHYFGLNLDAALLPAGVTVIRGKPPYRADWPGGIDAHCAGLILQGYHAMWGTVGGVLAHTYEPDIQAIWINDALVGETGVEAAVAGELGVPLLLFLGDKHGAEEAQILVPGVETVVVKEGMGLQMGLCRSWPDVREEIVRKAAKVAESPPRSRPLRFDAPVKMIFKLGEGPFRQRFFDDHPDLFASKEEVVLTAPSVSVAWARYWVLKDEILAKINN